MSITEHMVTGQDLSVISYNFLGIFIFFLLLSICYIFFITLCASCGTVYCNQSCLSVGVCVCMFVGLLP